MLCYRQNDMLCYRQNDFKQGKLNCDKVMLQRLNIRKRNGVRESTDEI